MRQFDCGFAAAFPVSYVILTATGYMIRTTRQATRASAAIDDNALTHAERVNQALLDTEQSMGR